VLERLESQMGAVLEAVTTSSQRLDAKIDALGAHLSERISVLEQVVRQNSDDIRKNSEDILALRNEVARLRHDFDHREERGRVDALEARVAALETRLGVG
jgi:predicted RNase H-like nuclease (RuvC/YqgF family)